MTPQSGGSASALGADQTPLQNDEAPRTVDGPRGLWAVSLPGGDPAVRGPGLRRRWNCVWGVTSVKRQLKVRPNRA